MNDPDRLSATPQLTARKHAHVAIGLVTKAPEPGTAKTRLCPPLTANEAANAAAAMIADTLAAARGSGYAVWVVFTGDETALRRTVGDDVALLAQRGANLGERLAAAQADLFDHGFTRVVLLGGDCPTVGVATVREAVNALDAVDVCMVPAVDGGYTLLASAQPCPEVFTEVTTGSDRTGAETVARADAAGLTIRQLDARYDLDTQEALLAALHVGQLDEAPATKAVAQRMAHLRSGG